MELLLFSIGAIGVLGMTWGFPVLASVLFGACSRRQSQQDLRIGKGSSLSLKILIPAHDCASSIAATLESILLAQHALCAKRKDVSCSIVVGLDGCSDDTPCIVARYGLRTLSFSQRLGKWRVIRALVRESRAADWVVLVDSGTVWREEFLLDVIGYMENPDNIAVAPAYAKVDGGAVESWLWSLECHLKGLESRVGGPVTVHGATVIYKLKELSRALAALADRDWLNDDVVVPLMLRTLNPGKNLIYLPRLAVSDGVSPETEKRNGTSRELRRRRRIVIGNSQWIRRILPIVCTKNRAAGLVAMRRAFRVLWSYWIAFIVAGILLKLSGSALVTCQAMTLILIAVLVLMRGSPESVLSRLSAAAAASLAAPRYILFPVKEAEVQWA